MAWNHTYDVNTPSGDDDPKEGDDRIREVKAAMQERMAKDHYFPKTGSQVSDEDAGEHKKVTLRVGSAPTKADDKGFIYVKDVDDKAELFYIDEDGDEVQLTTGGQIVALPPKVHSAVGTSNISTSSTSLVNMPDMSITATFPAGKVLVGFGTILRSPSVTFRTITWTLVIDDNVKISGGGRMAGDVVFANISLRWVETLTAGEHTIKVQWKVDKETVYQDGASYKRVLTVLECR